MKQLASPLTRVQSGKLTRDGAIAAQDAVMRALAKAWAQEMA